MTRSKAQGNLAQLWSGLMPKRCSKRMSKVSPKPLAVDPKQNLRNLKKALHHHPDSAPKRRVGPIPGLRPLTFPTDRRPEAPDPIQLFLSNLTSPQMPSISKWLLRRIDVVLHPLAPDAPRPTTVASKTGLTSANLKRNPTLSRIEI
ncbi:hypothetical protein L596_006270 [Steinernema carpocapsae]|uniref:Uncharacterized protein n=1 Tax=Steinernema carpocapsae TaxID=34508 RepID=A0A4U8V3D1_STECR|nr:hypothetical protein L596_006270 [Steinernema carpocapsae]